MNDARTVALVDAAAYFAGREPDLVVVEGELVSMVAHEVRTGTRGDYDRFAFRTVRVRGGEVIETWTNDVPGSAPVGAGVHGGEGPVPIGIGDPAVNKTRVADFFRCIFDAHNPGAVGDFYSVGFVQHARTQPQTITAMQEFVANMFPDGPIPTPIEADLPPVVLMGEGDIVVVASQVPQPALDGGMFIRNLFDAFRVREGMLVEHWSGQDPENMPRRPAAPGT